MDPIRCPHCGLTIVIEAGPEDEEDADDEQLLELEEEDGH